VPKEEKSLKFSAVLGKEEMLWEAQATQATGESWHGRGLPPDPDPRPWEAVEKANARSSRKT
jgi:hypothetical protein